MFGATLGKLGLASLSCFLVFSFPSLVQARTWPAGHDSAAISVAELPRPGRETYEAIGRGGPFRFEKDGVVFGNRERQLPLKRRGYYREYTVATPGSRSRGARRIVCGGAPRVPDVCYYSDNHYASFRRIVP
jgi:ribonuclease T1